MTEEQFEALKQWIASRTAIAIKLSGREYDKPYVTTLQKELDEVDEQAKAALVEDDAA